MKLVLIVEDDSLLAQTLKLVLQKEGLRVVVARNMRIARNLIKNYQFDLAILDRLLPDGDGMSLIKELLDLRYQTQVLILTTQAAVSQRIKGFRLGADEYLSKPFSQKELILRIKSLLAKQKIYSPEAISYNGIILFPETSSLVIDGAWRKIRRKESQILACLIFHQGVVVTDEVLVDFVWGSNGKVPTHRSISVYIRRIRMSLGPRAGQLKTVHGVGYRLD